MNQTHGQRAQRLSDGRRMQYTANKKRGKLLGNMRQTMTLIIGTNEGGIKIKL